MEKLSALLNLCDGNPSFTNGFLSQGASNAELWSFLLLAWIRWPTVKLPVIRNAMFLMCHHSNALWKSTLIASFMGPTWGPSGADRTQVGPMLAPWTLLSGVVPVYPKNYAYSVYILLCFSKSWFFPYPSRLLHWHWDMIIDKPSL